jgi:RNA polymerase sigma factor (sigma-70 family)
MDDWQLLQNYVERDSEPAFKTLVDRYVNLVYSVALRHVRDSHLAEEVAQAVFLLLARKARGLRRSVVLSGWLFRTTRFVASRAVRAEQRRQRREQEAFVMQRLTTPDEAWKRISPVLDEALEHLAETDRNAILLRFFSDKSHRETAAALGVSEEAAKKRVTRALDKLRDFFAGRGLALSAAVLASSVTANAAKAATPEVIAQVTTKVISTASTTAALPPLVTQTLNAWRWAKLRLASAMAITIAAVVGVGVAMLPKEATVNSLAADNNSASTIHGAPPYSSSISNRSTRKAARDERVLRFHVVARDTGLGVPNAPLAVLFAADGTWQTRFDLATDASGSANVVYPQDPGRLDVGVLSSGWAARFVEWKRENDPAIPEGYTMFVDRMTNAMGGWLRDEHGQPVANAEIEMRFSSSDSAQRETPRERPGFLRPAVVARSDQNGRWTCAVIDPKADWFPGIIARHPDFAPTDIAPRHQANNTNNAIREQMKSLWAGDLATTMAPGWTLTGRVTGNDGRPIADARVMPNSASTSLKTQYAETQSDHDGWFSFRGLPPGDFDFFVTAPGFAQEYTKVVVANRLAPMDVKLRPGGLLRLRLVDERGDAVVNGYVAVTGLGSTFSPDLNWSAESGPDGRIEWDSAPPGRDLNICASKHPDLLMSRGIMLKADGEEHVITLRRALRVTGSVQDAETGEPIHGVKAFPGYGLEEYCWFRGDTWRSTNETFQVRFEEEKFPWRVRVEAEGYEAFVSEPLSRDFSGTLDVALRRPDLTKTVRGVVLQPDGQPAGGAEIALLTPGHGAYLGQARFAHRETQDKLITSADAEGKFQFEREPDADTAHTAIAVGDSGFARVPLGQGKETLTIQLQPWGRVEGVVDSSARQRPVDSLHMEFHGPPGLPGTLRLGSDFYLMDFRRDDFKFEFVPPGDFSVSLNAGPGTPYPMHHRTWFAVKAGETTKILIADRGPRLKGRLVVTDGEGDWAKQSNQPTFEDLMPGVLIHSRQYMASKFAMLVALDPHLTAEENVSYNNPTLEAGLIPFQHNNAPGFRMDTVLALAADGSFESLEGVLPGDYHLQASINGRKFQQSIVTVPTGDTSTVDLGNISVNTNTPVTGRVVRNGPVQTKAKQTDGQ